MPAPVYACFWYDTEDYLTPAADDAAWRLARLHRESGLAATFKVVGQKARVLEQRGRIDVIRALREHSIGYHTDYHSVHPTVAEYCEALDWDEAEARFCRQESQGIQDVQRIFGRSCVTYGQPGGSWAPMVYPVLREWGVATYVDEGPWIGLGGEPFWYQGLLHVQRMERNRTRFDLRAAGDELDAAVRFNVIVKRLQDQGGGVVSLGFHPCEWVTDAFWDAVNFGGGANPPLDQLKLPPLTAETEVERRFQAMETYLRHVAESEVQAIGAGQLRTLYPDRMGGRFLTRDELVEATGEWESTVDFVRFEAGWLSAGEVLTVAAGLLRPMATLAPAAAKRVAQVIKVDGPRSRGPALQGVLKVSFDDLVAAADWVLERCSPGAERRPSGGGIAPLPSSVALGGRTVRPEEFLLAAIRALRSAATGPGPPSEVLVEPAELLPAQQVRDEPGVFGWAIHPAGFHAPSILEHARLQCWTLKPAVLCSRGA